MGAVRNYANIFYSPRYIAFYEDAAKTKIHCFVFKKGGFRAFLPYVQRGQTATGLRYGGIEVNTRNKDFIRETKNKLNKHLGDRRIKKLIIRDNPFASTVITGKPVLKEPFVLIDLALPRERLSRGISPRHRSCIEKAFKNNLKFDISKNRKYLDIFYRFHKNNLQSKGATPQPFSYFLKLYRYMKRNIAFSVIRCGVKIIAVSLVLESKPQAYLLYGGMDTPGYRYCAKHLMIYKLIALYKSRGYKNLVLGTGNKGRDSVYMFKRGFCAKDNFILTYEKRIH